MLEGEITVSTEPFSSAPPHVEAAGCVLRHEGKILLIQRSAACPEPHTWCIPGGKLQMGETPKEAVIREIYEEVGMFVDVPELTHLKTLHKRIIQGGLPLLTRFHVFLLDLPSQPKVRLHPLESLQYEWVSKARAKELPLITGASFILDLI